MIAAVMGYSMAHVLSVPRQLTRGWSAGCYAAALLPLLTVLAVVYLVARFS